jgi:hypothetical protein
MERQSVKKSKSIRSKLESKLSAFFGLQDGWEREGESFLRSSSTEGEES